MSRWIEGFNAHPFQESWKALQTNLDESSIDDPTVITSVQELARLKKVVVYLDGIIKGLDPELIPSSTWGNFASQADACNAQIENFNNNKNIEHITQANDHADNLLTYVRPYMILEGDIADALQKSMKSYARSVDQYGESIQKNTARHVDQIRDYKEKGDALFEAIESTKNTIDEYGDQLFGADDDSGIKDEIESLVEDFNEKYARLNEFHTKILIGNENETSTKKSIQDAKSSIISDREKVESILASVDVQVKELEKFHIKMFGDMADDDEIVGGMSADLDELMQDMTDFKEKQEVRYKALNDQIEELLPGATTAGLATAYKEMKESFSIPIANANRLFYASIVLLVFFSGVTAFEYTSETGLVLAKFEDWPAVLESLIKKLPFYIPVTWLAFYATRRRSEAQRLQQEYAHKESLAKSYNNFRMQIQALGDEDKAMQKEFIMKAVDAITYNASTTLDGKHGDKSPTQDVVEKVVNEVIKRLPTAGA